MRCEEAEREKKESGERESVIGVYVTHWKYGRDGHEMSSYVMGVIRENAMEL